MHKSGYLYYFLLIPCVSDSSWKGRDNWSLDFLHFIYAIFEFLLADWKSLFIFIQIIILWRYRSLNVIIRIKPSTQANFSISQALVTDISYANASFYGCTFASYQDTWYTGRNASTYVVDSIIFGQTDCKSDLVINRLFSLLKLASIMFQIYLDSEQRT